MKQFKINDKKHFTSLLFLENTFDSWILKEATFKTFQTITLDGKICKEYFSSDEEVPDVVTWGSCRQLCYQVIKGKHLPASFKIVLAAPADTKDAFLTSLHLSANEVGGLFLNLGFHDNELSITTGAALNSFPPDKSVIEAWDRYVLDALKAISIDFDEA